MDQWLSEPVPTLSPAVRFYPIRLLLLSRFPVCLGFLYISKKKFDIRRKQEQKRRTQTPG